MAPRSAAASAGSVGKPDEGATGSVHFLLVRAARPPTSALGMRRLFVLVCSIVFLDAMLFGALIPLVPGYVDEFHLSKLRPALLVSYGGGAVLGGIPGGLIAGRIGPKRAVIAGMLLLAVASFGFALAGSPGRTRSRAVRSGLFQHDDLGRRTRVAHRLGTARTARRVARHCLRDRSARRDPRPDVRRDRPHGRDSRLLRRGRIVALCPSRWPPRCPPRRRLLRSLVEPGRVTRALGDRPSRRAVAQHAPGAVLRRARRPRAARARRARVRRRRDRHRLSRRRPARDGAQPGARPDLRSARDASCPSSGPSPPRSAVGVMLAFADEHRS